jgi:hypothetical protein
MITIKCETVLDKQTNRYYFKFFEDDNSAYLIYQSPPQYPSHEHAEHAAIEFLKENLKPRRPWWKFW